MPEPLSMLVHKIELLATHWHYISSTCCVKFRTYAHLLQLIKEAVRNFRSAVGLF